MKKLPIGIQNFEKLITENYLYVDKTQYIYELITAGAVYFLSRPRRFGKSLLISTLESIFKGKKELFKNYWIGQSNYSWSKHPVIRIDFSKLPNKTPEKLEQSLLNRLSQIQAEYSLKLKTKDVAVTFDELIQELSKINQVVVLIDEYDKPIIDNILNTKIAGENRDILRQFYTVLKGADEYLKFVFLTGVSKFSKVSVFSGLNHLDDISLNSTYSALCGYTQDELEKNFSGQIEQLVSVSGEIKDSQLAKIRLWYNGYQFSRSKIRVYNPFSTLKLFSSNEFQNYWFETGTPTFLVKLVTERNFAVENIENEWVGHDVFSSYEIESLEILPLLLQTGYVTIKEYDAERELYLLGFPNYEVKKSFLTAIIKAFSNSQSGRTDSLLWKIISALNNADLPEYFDLLKNFFSKIPYELQISYEKYYQTIFYMMFTLIGLKIEAEVRTNKGRIDAIIETEKNIFIFEFKIFNIPHQEGYEKKGVPQEKLNKIAQEALAQIQTKGYVEKYTLDPREKRCIGVVFDGGTRNIGAWVE